MHVSFINKLPILISHYLYRSDQTVLIGETTSEWNWKVGRRRRKARRTLT